LVERPTDKGAADGAPKAGGVLEAHARLAIEAAGLGLWEWDVQNDLFMIDTTVAGLLGRPALAETPFESRKMTDLTHPDDRELVSHTIQSLLESDDVSSSLEHRIIKPSGELRWLGIKASVIQCDKSGVPRKIAGIVQDLTAAKRRELDLRAEKQRYDLATAGSLIAIWEWDALSGRASWSPRLAEILGLAPDMLSGEKHALLDRFHPDDLDRVRAATRAHVRNGVPYDIEFRIRHTAGHYVVIRSRGRAIRDADGELIRMAGSIVDITSEREAEAAASRAALRAELAMQAAGLGTWDFDARTQTVVMDEGLARMIGRSELAGRAISREEMYGFNAPEDTARLRPRMIALAKGEIDYVRDEHRVLHADGRWIWVFIHIGIAERDDEGRATRLIGITRDMTDQKKAEATLRLAKERAEAASEAKSSFIATMSHEIRTPLNGVMGIAQLLSLSQLDERQRTYVDTLMSSSKMLAGVIDDILDISRIEAGKLKLELEPTPLATWLQEAVEPYASTAREKGLSFTVRTQFDAKHVVRIDRQRMAQVVGNLVSNAVKFTAAGGVEIRLVEAGPDRIRIEIADNGPGIDPEMQVAIFDRFTQADMSPSRQHGGSGLGLAIARELTDLAGGEIGVVSIPEDGSTFWIEIPAPGCEADRPAAPEADGVKAILPGLDILIVEDHAVNRDMLADMMRQSGFGVEVAASGETALEMLAQRDFDAVLLDLHMPGLGGDETLRRIRAGEAGDQDVPVFFVTADATPQARDQAGRIGADGFFTKPVDMDEIVDALITAVSRSAARRSSA